MKVSLFFSLLQTIELHAMLISEGAYYKNYANYDTSMKIWEDR